MNSAYPIPNPDTSVFIEADETYAAIQDRLSSEWLSLSHDEVERALETEGRELMRQLYQGSLDLRTLQEVRLEAVVGSDERRRTHRRKRKRNVSIIFGKVHVERIGYGARGATSLFPLDAQLNLPADSFSFEIRRRVADLVATSAFDEATRRLRDSTGTKVAKRQVEELAERATCDFEAFYEQRQPPAVEDSAELLALSIDKKGVVVLHEHLREKTRNAAKTKKPRLDKRRSTGERRNRKRMALVAAVYTVAPWVRTADDVIAGLRGIPTESKLAARPRPEGKRIWASVTRESEAVVEQAFQEALARDPTRQKQWVILVDGDRHQLCWLKRAMKRHRIRATVVLDIIHVIEYLWIGARAFHKDPYSKEAERWVAERLKKVLLGRAGWVAGGIRRMAKQRGLSKDKQKRAAKCADYLKNYSHLMRYDEALKKGFPIGTGVIEGACRYLIKDRMDITGARWSLEGAEAVLRLRALRASGDFDEYWDFHRDREFARNHTSQFASPPPPPDGERASTHLRLVPD